MERCYVYFYVPNAQSQGLEEVDEKREGEIPKAADIYEQKGEITKAADIYEQLYY